MKEMAITITIRIAVVVEIAAANISPIKSFLGVISIKTLEKKNENKEEKKIYGCKQKIKKQRNKKKTKKQSRARDHGFHLPSH